MTAEEAGVDAAARAGDAGNGEGAKSDATAGGGVVVVCVVWCGLTVALAAHPSPLTTPFAPAPLSATGIAFAPAAPAVCSLCSASYCPGVLPAMITMLNREFNRVSFASKIDTHTHTGTPQQARKTIKGPAVCCDSTACVLFYGRGRSLNARLHSMCFSRL